MKRFGAPLTTTLGAPATGVVPAPSATLYNAATGGVIETVAASTDPAGVGFWLADFALYDPTLDSFCRFDGTAGGLPAVLGQGIAFAVDIVPTVGRDGVRVDQASAIDLLDECNFSAAYVDTSLAEVLRIKAWLTRGALPVNAPTAITITILNQDGTTLDSFADTDPEVSAAPDANGAFLLETAANQVVLADDQAYSVLLSITDAAGTVTTVRGMPTL